MNIAAHLCKSLTQQISNLKRALNDVCIWHINLLLVYIFELVISNWSYSYHYDQLNPINSLILAELSNGKHALTGLRTTWCSTKPHKSYKTERQTLWFTYASIADDLQWPIRPGSGLHCHKHFQYCRVNLDNVIVKYAKNTSYSMYL